MAGGEAGAAPPEAAQPAGCDGGAAAAPAAALAGACTWRPFAPGSRLATAAAAALLRDPAAATAVLALAAGAAGGAGMTASAAGVRGRGSSSGWSQGQPPSTRGTVGLGRPCAPRANAGSDDSSDGDARSDAAAGASSPRSSSPREEQPEAPDRATRVGNSGTPSHVGAGGDGGDGGGGGGDGDGDGDAPPSLGVSAALALLGFYRGVLSPLLPSTCRFLPTCSVYSIQSYKRFGVARGTVLTAWRLLRCNPWGGRGYDPPAWPPVGLGAVYSLPYTPEVSVVLGLAAAYWLVASTLESLSW